MTRHQVLAIAWVIVKLIASVLWTIIRACLIFTTAVVLGSIKGAGRAKVPSTSAHD